MRQQFLKFKKKKWSNYPAAFAEPFTPLLTLKEYIPLCKYAQVARNKNCTGSVLQIACFTRMEPAQSHQKLGAFLCHSVHAPMTLLDITTKLSSLPELQTNLRLSKMSFVTPFKDKSIDSRWLNGNSRDHELNVTKTSHWSHLVESYIVVDE